MNERQCKANGGRWDNNICIYKKKTHYVRHLKKPSLIVLGILLFIFIIILGINPAGKTYPIFPAWGLIILFILFTITVILLFLLYARDNIIIKKERRLLMGISIFLIVFYMFPSIISFNIDDKYVIDDVSKETKACEIDYYMAQYPNAVFMVIPDGISNETINKLKSVGADVGVHGLTHYFPEGLIPGMQWFGYRSLSSKIEVTAYRPPNYINNLIDYVFLYKLKFYPIGHKNMVIHIENGHC